jgi:hypothetical protein
MRKVTPMADELVVTKTRALLLAAVCMLVLLGTPACSGAVVFDADPEILTLTDAAADEWRDACGANIVVGPGNLGIHVEETAGLVDGKYWGKYSPSGRSLRVQHQSDPAVEQMILAHEMGHALGAGHAPSGIMLERSDGRIYSVTARDCDLLP